MSSKDYEKFERKLLNILNSSANAKAWSDLLPTTKEILLHLTKNQKDIDFSQITIKHMLAKRLAQCLNPEFPNGVHEVVLEIYKILITNIMVKQDMQLMDNLALYCSGLFPFFSHASLQNKEKFLNDIVKLNLLSIDPDELTLCFPGLLASLIPGLDDNNESTTKLIFQAFEDFITKLNNKQTFFGSYWTLLLRNKHLRSSGLKYLVENIIKYPELRKKPIEEQKTIIENYYPNINTTVINALSEIIKDEEIPTVRNGMDFILTRFPLTKENDIITDKAKINLIINALHLLIKNESSVIRRLNNWILGIDNPRDDVDYKSEDMHYKMNLVTEAFKNIFNPEKNYSTEELLNNLKILEGFFGNQPKFSKFILSKVSYFILKCVVNYWQVELNGSENVNNNEIISKVSKFFSKNKNIELLWISLADKLKSITEIEILEDNNNKENESNNNSETNNTSVQINENSDDNSYNHLLDEINDNIDPLKFCLIFIDIKTDIGKINYYFPIITHLLNITQKIKIINRDRIKDIRHIVLLTLVFIRSLQDNRIYNNDEIESQLSNQLYGNAPNGDEDTHKGDMISRPSVFQVMSSEDSIYVPRRGQPLGKYSISEESSLKYILKINKNNSNIIDSLTASILNYQQFYIYTLCQYFKITKDMQITKYEVSIFKQCTELVLRLQEYSRQEGIPLWVYYLEKLIFYPTANIKISFEAAHFILDLYSSSFNNSETYENIKYNCYYNPLPESVIDKEVLQLIIQKTGVQNNCYELLMGKLYLILLEQNNQRAVIDLLVKTAKLDIEKFEKMVLQTISFTNYNSIVEGIKLFSEFWKLSNEFYPDLIFFNSGECIFKMVDYLDNKNPLLRHLSKTWLNQVNQRFSKILDPIIGIFLSNDINLLFEEEQIYFEKEYNTVKILGAFSKLKNIILNSPFVSFLIDEKAINTDTINLEKIGNPTLATLNYLCLLISIALRFTQARCKEDVNNEFKEESYSVNAASCEFLEFLVNIISDGDLLINVANEINRPLLNLLDKAIENNDEVMQVQLLAIIKIIDFNSSAQYENNPDKKNIILSLLKDDILTKVLIKGMTSDYYFVRENFINFTKNCLPIFSAIIEKKAEFENIFGLGVNFISSLTNYLANKIYIEKIGRKDNEKFSHFDNENNKIIFKNYLEEYKEYKLFDENDVLLILKGIKDILLFFLNIEYNDQDNPKEKKDNLSSSFSSFSPISIFKKSKSKSLTLNNQTIFNFINNHGISNNTNDFDGNWIDFKKSLVNSQKFNKNYIFTISEQNSPNETEPDKDEDEKISIVPNNLYTNQIYNLLNGLILTWINQSDRYEVYDYCLNLNGILAPTEINSWNNISNIELQNAKEMINKNPIKKIIIEIAFNLFCSNSIRFIEKVLDIWCFGQKGLNNNLSKVNASVDKQFQLSIIELLISMNIPVNMVLYCVNRILLNKLKSEGKNKKYIKDPKTKIMMTPYDYSLYEAKIFHFIYSYILLNPIYDKKETTEIWKEITNIFYTIINNSKILYTFCWLYEVMQLSLDKFQIKNIDNNEIIKSIYDTFNIVTTKLMDASFDNKLDSQYFSDEKLVIPILPHVYTNIVREIFKKDNLYKKDTGGGKLKKETENEINLNKLETLNSVISNGSISFNNTNELNNYNNDDKFRGMTFAIVEKEKGTLSTFYDDYYTELGKSSEYNTDPDEVLNNTQGHGMLNLIYRQLAMITLKENYFKLYASIFGEKLTDIKKQLTEILKGIIYLIKSKDSLLKECASDFLVSLMEDCPKNVTKYGKELIMNYFNDANFFKTDSINLHNWRKIISHYADYYPEIINDLLNNIDSKNIFLAKTSDDDKIRILRRISFVIYSCKKDTFSKQFDLIQSKAKDLLSGYSSNNNNLLESEIFLIMRILFLRFSHEGVMKMIRDLWPIIFNELIQNIENEERNKHIHLLAESFKFIELLSLANIEEFSLYEWIFIMDTYNMNYLDTRKEDSMLNRLLSSENKAFKPLALNILIKGNLEVTDSLLEGKHKGKSELYIRTKKDTFEELFKGVKKFFYSIVDMNSYKVPVNFEQIEQIIEEDFIDHNREE
jgi:hypothetical protein